MSKNVLILGANGHLGRVVVQEFANAGWTVLAQARRPLIDPAKGKVQHIGATLEGVVALAKNAGGVDVVINALSPLYTAWNTEAIPMARAASEVALQLGATLIFPGNVYNFGKDMPAVLSETTAQHPSAQKGLIRCQIEQELKDRATDGLRSIVLRAGDFFGGYSSGSWMDLAITKNLTKGRAAYPGPMEVVHSWAYLPDFARTLVALAESRSQCGAHEVFHFPGHAITGSRLIAALTQVAQRSRIIGPGERLKPGGFPWRMVRIGGLLMPMWREISKMRYLWSVPHRLSGDKLEKIIGTIPCTPLEQALAACCSDLPGKPA